MLADDWDGLGGRDVEAGTPVWVSFVGNAVEIFFDKLLPPRESVAAAHNDEIIADRASILGTPARAKAGLKVRTAAKNTHIGTLSPLVTMVALPAGVRLTWGKTFVRGSSPSVSPQRSVVIKGQLLKAFFFPNVDPAKIAPLGVQVEKQTRGTENRGGICRPDCHLGGHRTVGTSPDAPNQ